MSELEVSFSSYPCECPDRSWSFPASAELRDEEGGVSAHWQDGVGWVACDPDEDEYTRLYSIGQELNLEAPTFEAWQMRMQSVVAAANQLPLEHWLPLWRQWLDKELAHAENLLAMAERIVAKERRRRRAAECRAVAARIEDPGLAATAHRLLAQEWAGTPAELLATAEAVSR